jgi:hypothetical protein
MLPWQEQKLKFVKCGDDQCPYSYMWPSHQNTITKKS